MYEYYHDKILEVNLIAGASRDQGPHTNRQLSICRGVQSGFSGKR